MNVNFNVDFNPTIIKVGLLSIDALAFIGSAWAYIYWRRVNSAVCKALEECERREATGAIPPDGEYVAVCGIASSENGQFLESRDRSRVGFVKLYTLNKHVTRRQASAALLVPSWTDETVPIERITELVPFRIVSVANESVPNDAKWNIKGVLSSFTKLAETFQSQSQSDDQLNDATSDSVRSDGSRSVALSIRVGDAKKAEFLFEPTALVTTHSAYRELDKASMRLALEFLSGDIVHSHSETERMMLDGSQCVAIGSLRRAGVQADVSVGSTSGWIAKLLGAGSVRSFEILPPRNGLPLIVTAYSFTQLREAINTKCSQWLLMTTLFGSIGAVVLAFWAVKYIAQRRMRQQTIARLNADSHRGVRPNIQPTGGTATGVATATGSECVICTTAPRDVLCVPCNHISMCVDCSVRYCEINQASAEHLKCPICRAPIEELQRVYNA